jgi:hypothetical protein
MSPMALRARLATSEAPCEALSHCCDDAIELDTVIYYGQRDRAPETKTGFLTKQACEQAAANWRANFETQVKEGTIRTESDRRRRTARAVPSIKCVESTKIPQ